MSKMNITASGLFKNSTNNTFVQLFRYTFVGGFAFVIDFITLAVLTEIFHIYYLISAAIAFLLGLIINYILSVLWVFSRHTSVNRWIEFGIFGFIGIIGLGLNELFIWFFTEITQFHYLISKIISTFFVYLWNFFARKYILFK